MTATPSGTSPGRGRIPVPKVPEGTASLAIKPSELAMLLEGIDLSSVKRSKRYRRLPGLPAPLSPG